MIRLPKIKLLYLVIILVVSLFLLAGFIAVALWQQHGDASGQVQSVGLSIPDAEDQDSRVSKTGSYAHGSGSDYYNSLDEEETQRSDAGASSGMRQPPEAVVPEDVFRPEEEPAPRPAPRRSTAKSASRTESTASAAEESREAEPSAPVQKTMVKRSGAVSSLDDTGHDLGNGFSTLDGSEGWVREDEGRPYSCMFIRDEKVRGGQRVTVRLLEDIIVSGTHIPRNTHLQGVCTITDRMELYVGSLDTGGRILSLNFEAFDTDGGKGIYCSDLSKTAKDVAEQGITTASSLLSGRLGRVARDITNLGASIVRGKNGEATVSIPAGYTFYLIEKKN